MAKKANPKGHVPYHETEDGRAHTLKNNLLDMFITHMSLSRKLLNGFLMPYNICTGYACDMVDSCISASGTCELTSYN